MKKILMLMTLTSLYFCAIAQNKVILFSDLPQAAQKFISNNYSAKEVSYVVMDKEFFSTSYEVKMNNGIEIEFDGKGNWKEVDAGLLSVPNNVVPKKIRQYVNKSFPNNEIVKISRNKRKYEIELKNGLDIEFNKQGEFLRVD